jgi:hypothetical protein
VFDANIGVQAPASFQQLYMGAKIETIQDFLNYLREYTSSSERHVILTTIDVGQVTPAILYLLARAVIRELVVPRQWFVVYLVVALGKSTGLMRGRVLVTGSIGGRQVG